MQFVGDNFYVAVEMSDGVLVALVESTYKLVPKLIQLARYMPIYEVCDSGVWVLYVVVRLPGFEFVINRISYTLSNVSVSYCM